MKSFAKYHLPAVLYAAAILIIPSLPGFRTPAVRFLVSDKLAHFLEYAVFALLAYRSVSHWSERLQPRMMFLISFLVLAVFAVVDEVLQRFIPGRQTDIWDYVADLCGGVAVYGLLVWWRRRRSRTRG
ncbi:MAG: VanZ family protein [Candidatus Zixiibacteriota bacterium]